MRSRLIAHATSTAAILALAAVTLTACGGSSSPDTSSKTVDLQTWAGSTADQDRWNTLATQANNTAGVTVNTHFSTFDSYNEKIGTLLAAGQAGCIVRLQDPRMAGYVSSLLPLDDLIKSSKLDTGAFQKTAMDNMKFNGTQYGIPTDLGPAVVYYNPEMFKAAGVPEPTAGWAMKDFLTAAKSLTGNGKFGLALGAEDIEMLSLALNSTGGTPVDTNGAWQLTSPDFSQGIQNWADLIVKNGYSAPLSGASQATATAAAQQNFINGNAAMMIGGPWDFQAVKGKTKFSPQVAQIPAGSQGNLTYTNGSGFSIAKSCPNPQAAFDAIKAAVAPDFQAVMGKFGAFPALISAQDNWFGNTGFNKSVFAASFDAARPMPAPKKANWNVGTQLLGQYAPQIANGPNGAASALDAIQKKVG
ncbi:ABC transporter substrate-binding protein [Psychromicrobium xiongbiense]|uniref:ABC transporter substrate-binding protein n=1 Tax=Psychromicrobium xiongbiense TaxID=3051184 RepID=UPI00255443EA|nr:extracellular solute-binding protein [Psychromicrobium sp. YIM S02556]